LINFGLSLNGVVPQFSMSISKLYLFSKNTDAPATEQGFHYQKLKTLKTWLENRINEVNERIYCDYEEDIFQRNISAGESKFRQVKLYSSNFSFSKDEIQKSIAHFFMLFVKGDYLHDEVSFLFETNSGIAKETRGNDADLLTEWYQNQETLSPDLNERVKKRVIAIIDQYINEAYENHMDDASKTQLQEAKIIYDSLPNEVWDKFIASIRWQFDDLDPKDAVPQLLAEVEVLAAKLPVRTSQPSTCISILHFEIQKRTGLADGEEKFVTNDLLDVLVLNDGDEKDKWYADVYQKMLHAEAIGQFNIGAFYEVINAARHCRWDLYETRHAELWLRIMKLYIDHKDTLLVCKRKAIYEYIFLQLSPDPKTGRPNGTMAGQEELVHYYFEQFEQRISLSDLNDDITFLQLVETHKMLDEAFVKDEEITAWANKLNDTINDKIGNARDADEKCLAIELQGTLKTTLHPVTPLKQRIEEGLADYAKILPLLNDTHTYSITNLSDQLGQILKMLILHDADEYAITAIENFLYDIEEAATKTGRQHDAAHSLVERGSIYLKKPEAKNFLKGLDCFHKAKMLWNLDQTREGFVLALLNISQVYSGLGMNLAAKYYGLCAVWASENYGDPVVFKRISDGFAMVFHADVKQGAWISALDDYWQFIHARIEYRPESLNFETDELFRKTSMEHCTLLAVIPILHPELTVFIEYYKKRLTWVYTEILAEWVEGFSVRFSDKDVVKDFLTHTLTGEPLNDIGPKRHIKFKAYGIEWNISVINSAIGNAIGEEFCSLLQVTLSEIGLLGVDFHLLQVPVQIEINVGTDYKAYLDQRPSHDETVYDLSIPPFHGKEQAGIQYHYGYIATNINLLLKDLSLLPGAEFDNIYDELYTRQKLGEKGLAINTYQKVYFNFQSPEAFDDSRRADFSIPLKIDFDLKIPNVLPSFKGQSAKYDEVFSKKKITERYEILYDQLKITLEKWSEELLFHSLVERLRKEGWLNWQILMALGNYILSKKARIFLSEREMPSENPEEDFKKEFFRLKDLPESECYIEVPINALGDSSFLFSLDKMHIDTLKTFGLDNHMRFPNFEGVRRFLIERFSFGVDDVPEKDPIRDIG
jgi:hypothetical protein